MQNVRIFQDGLDVRKRKGVAGCEEKRTFDGSDENRGYAECNEREDVRRRDNVLYSM